MEPVMLTRLGLNLRSARTRLTLWNVVVLTLVMAAVAGILRTSVERNLLASVDDELRHRSLRHLDFWANVPWASHARTAATTRNEHAGKSDLQKYSALPPENVGSADRWRAPVAERVFDLNGMQSFPSYRGEAPWAAEAFRRAIVGHTSYTIVSTDGIPLRVLSAPLRRKSGMIAGVVQIASGIDPVYRTLANVDRALVTVLPIGLVAAWLGGTFLTGRMLRPVREVTQTASRIGVRDLSERLPVSGSDEFSELAETMNKMLARLEASFEQQQRFTGDASHELRTPLTVVMSVASRLLAKKSLPDDCRPSLERLVGSANVMEGIVRDLLLLARSDSGQLQVQMEPQSLSAILESAAACVPQDGAPVIRMQDVEECLTVSGDASQLTRLFSNLLNNAVRHTPSDGRITVSAQEQGARVLVSINDTGTGIAAEHLPHVTERFYRVDTGRARSEGGTGLGLAICTSIVEAHGGNLRIDSIEGRGTTVIVDLPAGSDLGSRNGELCLDEMSGGSSNDGRGARANDTASA